MNDEHPEHPPIDPTRSDTAGDAATEPPWSPRVPEPPEAAPSPWAPPRPAVTDPYGVQAPPPAAGYGHPAPAVGATPPPGDVPPVPPRSAEPAGPVR